MYVRIKLSALQQTRWHEYLIRFVLGGLATVFTGAMASLFGPETGGLFLALPVIFCASATLIEKHERERKEKAGLSGSRPGKLRASRLRRRDLAVRSCFVLVGPPDWARGLVRDLDALVVHPPVDMERYTFLRKATR
jgi:uncharacterized protein DUF3147